MQIPNEIEIETKLKLFLKDVKINEVKYNFNTKPYKLILKFCKKMNKLGYVFNLQIDKQKISYRDGEIKIEE